MCKIMDCLFSGLKTARLCKNMHYSYTLVLVRWITGTKTRQSSHLEVLNSSNQSDQ